MNLFNNRNTYRWFIIAISFIVISLILWNSYVFTQHFKEEERLKMEIWSMAQSEINQTTDLNKNLGDLPLEVLQKNNTTPMIIINKNGDYNIRNIKEFEELNTNDLSDSERKRIEKLVTSFKSQNEAIDLTYKDESLGTIYYGDSDLITKLKYYPLALVLIIFLLGTIIFLFYKSSKASTQNKLWAGMAKETAHQIGTPLSSLYGWLELLKSEKVDPSISVEIEKDINRLQTITDRFSKIGSIPNLERANIVEETRHSFQYLSARLSKHIEFNLEIPEEAIFVNLNKQLYSWTIENLVKNAIDAMKGKGNLKVSINQLEETVRIDVIDTGKGLAKKDFKKIFEPGFTTKKRGWGLGLSLANRIIEDYHSGKIKVLKSEAGSGTTIRISLKSIA